MQEIVFQGNLNCWPVRGESKLKTKTYYSFIKVTRKIPDMASLYSKETSEKNVFVNSKIITRLSFLQRLFILWR